LKLVWLWIFLTSRPDIPIRHGFYQIPESEHQDFVLHNILPSIVNHDISIFLRYSLKLIASEHSLGASWLGEQVIERLVYNASGLFIWAATACWFIGKGKQFAIKRLDMILESSSTIAYAPEKHLDEIYLTVLWQLISLDFTAEEADMLYHTLRSLLGSVVVLFSMLSIQSLSKLTHTSQEEVHRTLEDCHSILDVPKEQTGPLHLHHPSFCDFLLNKDQSGDFWVDEKKAHKILAAHCIQLISKTLKKNICEMHAPGSQASQVRSSWIKKCLPLEVQYVCLYWVQHLQRSGS